MQLGLRAKDKLDLTLLAYLLLYWADVFTR